MICKNLITEEIVIAKQVKFRKNKLSDSDPNVMVITNLVFSIE